ncbi:MAG: hypothetical protein GXO08_02590 [Aquificae bacterium]|nr:hypothetical protein [Aquificota bacterium]
MDRRAEKLFNLYKFFAFLFSYPRDESFFENLERFYPFDDRRPLEELKSVPLEELQAEYTSLFEFRYGGVPCKPYQSFFSPERLLMGEAALSSARFYDLFGLEVKNELPDRASVQFDFAAFLVKLAAETDDPSERKKVSLLYVEFFEKHLRWTRELARCVEENSSIRPLKELVRRLEEFLSEEEKRVKTTGV